MPTSIDPLAGDAFSRGATLVAVVKPDCDGCRSFTHGDLTTLEGRVEVILVSATNSLEWSHAPNPVVVAPAWVAASGVRGAPHYLLVGEGGRILGEGVVFSPDQVAREIEPLLE